MKDEIITINKGDIVRFSTIGAKLVLKKDAEDALVQLLDLKDYIDTVVEEVKAKITEGATQVYPDWKGVVGSKLKAIHRYYGDKYETTNPDFQKQIISTRVDSTRIDSYIEENGVLPEGVTEKERIPKLVITRI